MGITMAEIKHQKELFEADGRQALGIRLTATQAAELRHELHHYYGKDPGPRLTTLYGMEILSIEAPALSFE